MDALSSAVSFCLLKFLLKKDQIHAVNDYLKGRDDPGNAGYGVSESPIFKFFPQAVCPSCIRG